MLCRLWGYNWLTTASFLHHLVRHYICSWSTCFIHFGSWCSTLECHQTPILLHSWLIVLWHHLFPRSLEFSAIPDLFQCKPWWLQGLWLLHEHICGQDWNQCCFLDVEVPTYCLSTTEAEYVAACKAGKEIVWMCKLLQEISFKSNGPLTLHMDNQSAIQVVKHPEHHGRMKHLDLRWYLFAFWLCTLHIFGYFAIFRCFSSLWNFVYVHSLTVYSRSQPLFSSMTGLNTTEPTLAEWTTVLLASLIAMCLGV